MVKHSVIAAALVAALVSATSIAAITNKKPAIKVNPAYTWTGFYAGAHSGYGFGETKVKATSTSTNPYPMYYIAKDFEDATSSSTSSSSHKIKGGFAGLHAGYLHQFKNNIVVGVEVEGNIANIKGRSHSASSSTSLPYEDMYDMYDYKKSWSEPSTNYVYNSKVKWFGSLRAKLGYAVDRVLFYGFAGPAFAGLKYGVSATTTSICEDDLLTSFTGKNVNKFGYTFGAGVAYAVTDTLSVNLEYARYDFGKTRVSTSSSSYFDGFQSVDHQFKTAFNTVRVGITYKF